MAIKFLDGITVDGDVGIGTTSPISYSGYKTLTVDGASGAVLRLDRTDNTNQFEAAVSSSFTYIKNINSKDLWFGTNNSERMRITSAGDVGIGTTTPSDGDLTIGTPKLHVAVGGTSGTFNLAARFQSTTADANNTGTSILINSSNDRGLLIKAGRKDSDREVAYFDLVSSAGNTTNMLTMGKYGSAYNVGIGTTSPSHLLEVQSDTAIASINGATTNGKPMLFVGESNAYGVGFRWDSSLSLDIVDFDNTTPTTTSGTKIGHFKIRDEQFYWKGSIGLGTTSPATKLDILDSVNQTAIRVTNNNYNNYLIQKRRTDNSQILGVQEFGSNGGLSLVTGGSQRLNVNNLGNVGIGTTSPSTKLDVNGTFQATSVRSTGGTDGGFVLRQWTYSSNYASLATNGMSSLEYCMISDGTNTFVGAGSGGSLYLRGPANDSSPQIELDGSLCKIDAGDFKVEDGSIAVGTINNSATNGRIDASNDIVAFSTSDIRLKDNIKSIDKALDKVNSIQGIEFDWIEKEEVHGNSGHDIGVIAQEIEKILPDVVTTRDNGYKAVKYEKIVPLLIEAIKDLSKQVDGLKRLI